MRNNQLIPEFFLYLDLIQDSNAPYITKAAQQILEIRNGDFYNVLGIENLVRSYLQSWEVTAQSQIPMKAVQEATAIKLLEFYFFYCIYTLFIILKCRLF